MVSSIIIRNDSLCGCSISISHKLIKHSDRFDIETLEGIVYFQLLQPIPIPAQPFADHSSANELLAREQKETTVQ